MKLLVAPVQIVERASQSYERAKTVLAKKVRLSARSLLPCIVEPVSLLRSGARIINFPA